MKSFDIMDVSAYTKEVFMKKLGKELKIEKKNYPIKIVQFGEGNFLRAFVDWMINELNENNLFLGSVMIIQPIEYGLVDILNDQNSMYTLIQRGILKDKNINDKKLIKSIAGGINPYTNFDKFLNLSTEDSLEFVISNTTEAGITFDSNCKFDDAPPSSYPGKLTRFLYERYTFFNGNPNKGLDIIPCELIDRNGDKLKKCVLEYVELWGLSNNFRSWILNYNNFLVSLVDRIVTGYPKLESKELCNEIGYEDNLLDACEPFHLWVIEGDSNLFSKLPFDKLNLNVVLTENIKPYRDRKVKILNGAHTMTVLGAYLYGFDTVLECMNDTIILKYMKKGLFQEVFHTLDLEQEDINYFATSVLERFSNPYIVHKLLDISLNSFSKFKARVLPSLIDYSNLFDKLPPILSLSFSFLLAFYKGKFTNGKYIGTRNDETYEIKDNQVVLEKMNLFYINSKDTSSLNNEILKIMTDNDLWGMDLTNINGFYDATCTNLNNIFEIGIKDIILNSVGDFYEE